MTELTSDTQTLEHATQEDAGALAALLDVEAFDTLLEYVDTVRQLANGDLDEDRRCDLGQFMTPAPTARLMARLFDDLSGDIRLLDAGAGVGSLTAAVVDETCSRTVKPDSLSLTVYELEDQLLGPLQKTLQLCQTISSRVDTPCTVQLHSADFIEQVTQALQDDLFASRIAPQFNRVILNPPYRKINSQSATRRQLRSVGIETSNLYAAFVALSIQLLEDGGELVAITPRSFCNGPYFRPFREILLGQMPLRQIHIFHSRNKAFKGDKVLQENIIFHAVKAPSKEPVLITSSACAEDPDVTRYLAAPETVANPYDPERVIHILTSDEESAIAQKARRLSCTLDELGLQVSTGRVVDFRARKWLRKEPDTSTVPLIYPCHFQDGFIAWTNGNTRKPNALVDDEDTQDLMVPAGIYVLTKRFSAKEERRRIVAAIYDPKNVPAEQVGFENHLNYFHAGGQGLLPVIARGLALFLNSSLVDQYFRQFNGHTQVNATDLRSLAYPSEKQLKRLGNRYRTRMPEQAHIDQIIEETLFA